MTLEIAAILGIDGVANGAIYILVAIGLVLIFTVTRVIFVPFGDIAAFTALTLAALENRQVPGTISLVIALAVIAALIEVVSLVRRGDLHAVPRALLFYLGLPLLVVALVRFGIGFELPMAARIALAILLVLPIAPLLDRIIFRDRKSVV